MNLNKLVIFAVFLFLIFNFIGPSAAEQSLQNSIVRVYAVQSGPDYDNPWNILRPEQGSGSGCVIDNNRILTNAHVVSNQTFVQVRLHGSSTRHKARVVAVSHDPDLALLTVDDPAFFENVEPLKLGALPDVQQEVLVFGFPIGGDTLSTTKGVISRIEHQLYVHSFVNLLAAQLDAAINPGNSGGPAIVDNKVVGVAMQGLDEGDNIGYMVPVPVIKHFLTDLEDGNYDGFPDAGFLVQTMENPGLRKMYGMSDNQTGVLVTEVLPGSPATDKIMPGDILLSVDGHEIANDETVTFRALDRTSSAHFVQMHQIGEQLSLEILRDGKQVAIEFELTTSVGHYKLVDNYQYDVKPSYFIYGGLVFQPLTMNYLITWGKMWELEAPTELAAVFYDNPHVEGEKAVILANVLPDDINVGYHELSDLRITEVNGHIIHNMRELIKVVAEESNAPFICFNEKHGQQIVLDRKKVEEKQDDILKTYNIAADRSEDLFLTEKEENSRLTKVLQPH